MIDDFFADETAKASKVKKTKKKRKNVKISGFDLGELDHPVVKIDLKPIETVEMTPTPIKDDFESELGLESVVVGPSVEVEEDVVVVTREENRVLDDGFEKDLLDYQETVNLSEKTLRDRMGDFKRDSLTVILIHMTVGKNEYHVKVKADKSVGKVIDKFKTGEVIYFPQLRMYLSPGETFYSLIGLREVLVQEMGMLVCRGFLITKAEAEMKLKEQTASSQPEDDNDEDDVVIISNTTESTAEGGPEEEFPITLLISEKLKYKVMVKPDTLVDALYGYLEGKTPGTAVTLMFDHDPLERGVTIGETEIEDGDIIDVTYL